MLHFQLNNTNYAIDFRPLDSMGLVGFPWKLLIKDDVRGFYVTNSFKTEEEIYSKLKVTKDFISKQFQIYTFSMNWYKFNPSSQDKKTGWYSTMTYYVDIPADCIDRYGYAVDKFRSDKSTEGDCWNTQLVIRVKNIIPGSKVKMSTVRGLSQCNYEGEFQHYNGETRVTVSGCDEWYGSVKEVYIESTGWVKVI